MLTHRLYGSGIVTPCSPHVVDMRYSVIMPLFLFVSFQYCLIFTIDARDIIIRMRLYEVLKGILREREHFGVVLARDSRQPHSLLSTLVVVVDLCDDVVRQ